MIAKVPNAMLNNVSTDRSRLARMDATADVMVSQ
jgi:hypothetical protein